MKYKHTQEFNIYKKDLGRIKHGDLVVRIYKKIIRVAKCGEEPFGIIGINGNKIHLILI